MTRHDTALQHVPPDQARAMILEAYERNGGRVSATAEDLGISRVWLFLLVRRLGLRDEVVRVKQLAKQLRADSEPVQLLERARRALRY